MDIVSELENRFPNPADIELEQEKKPYKPLILMILMQ